MSEFSQNFMKWCASRSDLFIETGTFKGSTTGLASKYFKDVVTIEIDEANHNYAKNKLKSRTNIQLLQGDTVDLFPEVVKDNATKKSTFWLDAHPMNPDVDANCPLLDELAIIQTIGKRNDHIIIIDDLQRSLQGIGDYPKVDDMVERLKLINPDYHIYQLPFKSWKTPIGEPSVLCASTEEFDFDTKFYLNKFSLLKKYKSLLFK